MLETFRNAWKIEELRKKILFTLFIVLLYRLGNAVPVPYVNIDALKEYFTTLQNTALGLVNMMSGGAFSKATIFALSIQPYINASIIIQLLTIAIPALERLQKEGGEEGLFRTAIPCAAEARRRGPLRPAARRSRARAAHRLVLR